ncbi:MAG: S8 family serine peptidase [Bacteroidales bacterium]|nr:S8 family serine peptidase [Bacteroidales bacterium]
MIKISVNLCVPCVSVLKNPLFVPPKGEKQHRDTECTELHRGFPSHIAHRISHIAILLLLLSQAAIAQKYAVHFKDKDRTPYQLDAPSQFLSERALERRYKFEILLSDDDLPVNPAYIQQVADKGATILFPSKWLNCVLVDCDDDAAIDDIKTLGCVERVVLVAHPRGREGNTDNTDDTDFHRCKYTYQQYENQCESVSSVSSAFQFYGNASDQIEQLNGIALHNKGYDGEGVLIAVLDGGFCNVNTIDAFAHLYESGRLLMAKDFIEPGGDIYRSGITEHGTSVLSCMAAYLPNRMVGTAPKASYCLFRTENTLSEYLIEEYTWVIGAETADSIGADLINSSLVYTKYDDPTMSHTYSDMDGRTTIAAIGARKAVERGIFVCTSAGNEGDNVAWRWIGTPADVAEALTVGAVQQNGQYASFSSIGPNAAGEQKPNVMARGADATIINAQGAIISGSGTSYSSPIVCGMVACLLQASPFTPPEKLKTLIESSANLYANPSYQMGYGIPDFNKTLKSLPVPGHSKCNNILVYPNPASGLLTVKSQYHLEKALLYDFSGRLVAEQLLEKYHYTIATQELRAGMYVIHFYDDEGMVGCAKFVKN